MQKEVWAIVFAFFFISSSYSQEKSIYRQAYIDPFLINPACTGSELLPIVRLSVEKRWTGFQNSPSTVLVSGNTRIGSYDFYTPGGLVNKSPFRIGDNTAVGGALFYDNNGPLKTTGGMLSYAFHVPLNNESRLSMGLSAYMANSSVSIDELSPEQPDDEYLLNERDEIFRLNFGIGLFYYNNQFFSGLSVTGLFPMYSGNQDTEISAPGYYLLSGYRFKRISKNIDLEPSVIISRPTEEEFCIDFFTRVYFKDYHWAALSYNTFKQAEVMFALRLYNSFYLAYNYMYNLGKIAAYHYGSHRISIGMNLGIRGISKWNYYN